MKDWERKKIDYLLARLIQFEKEDYISGAEYQKVEMELNNLLSSLSGKELISLISEYLENGDKGYRRWALNEMDIRFQSVKEGIKEDNTLFPVLWRNLIKREDVAMGVEPKSAEMLLKIMLIGGVKTNPGLKIEKSLAQLLRERLNLFMDDATEEEKEAAKKFLDTLLTDKKKVED